MSRAKSRKLELACHRRSTMAPHPVLPYDNFDFQMKSAREITSVSVSISHGGIAVFRA